MHQRHQSLSWDHVTLKDSALTDSLCGLEVLPQVAEQGDWHGEDVLQQSLWVGRETKIRVSNLPTDWHTFTFPLSSFDTADLTRLYVVTEFVFEPGTPAETVYFRNTQYLP